MSLWPLERRARGRAVWGMDAQALAWRTAEGSVQLGELAEAGRAALAATQAAPHVDVIASNALAVHWVQQPPSSARGLEELKLVARARCAHLYGGTPTDWWIAGDWSSRRPFVCSALPRALAEPVQRTCEAQGVRVRWHSAWSVMCSARARSFPADGWSAMRSPQRVMLWHCTRGQVDALSGVSTTPEASRAELDAALQLQIKLESVGGGGAQPVHWADTKASRNEAAAALLLADLLGNAR